MEHRAYMINKIFLGLGADAENNETGNNPNLYLEVQGKFTDYDTYVKLFDINFNDKDYKKEYMYLMFSTLENIKIVPKITTEAATAEFDIDFRVIAPPRDTINFLSKFELILTPQLQKVEITENSEFIHECTRGYYKNGYLMIYGKDEANEANRGNTIFISDVNRPNYFPQYSTIDIATEGGERIQSINS
ncbi:hypothetical protein Zmor_012221 [Zophobas morio]|uniref:Uncharacterized protein n=1 Tax=Zophobas morio TaxID=2755281 RepID=A0AA38HH40_9CUCU|nr:hypothetical protein Zmor_012221 [Zophobas morio]